MTPILYSLYGRSRLPRVRCVTSLRCRHIASHGHARAACPRRSRQQQTSICYTSQQPARGGLDRSAPGAATAVAEEVSRGNDTFRSGGLLASVRVRKLSIVT